MDFGKAVKKPFTDIKKLLIGILLSILPIVKWFAKGFILESSGMGKTPASDKMPDWTSWGDYFIKGLVSWVIGIIYMIPAMIVVLIGAGSFIASMIRAYVGNIIPGGLVESVAAGGAAPEALEAIVQQNWVQAVPSLLALAPVLLLGVVLAILAAYVLPVAVLSYVKTNNFVDAFGFGGIFKKALTGNYFVAWIVVIIVSIIIGALLSWIPVVGTAMAFFISGVIGYTLFGEVLAAA